MSISTISTYVPPIVTTYISISNPLSGLPIPSLPRSVSHVSLSASWPSYNSVPFTYPNPSIVVPSVQLVYSSIPANSYTFPSVSNTLVPFFPSNDSTILSLAQTMSSLQQQLASFTQSKFNVPTCNMGSPLSFEIIHTTTPLQDDVTRLETYNGKGDHVTHLKTFQVLCSDYAHDHRILAKLLSHIFYDKNLQWYCSFPPYSIDSFHELDNAFIQKF